VDDTTKTRKKNSKAQEEAVIQAEIIEHEEGSDEEGRDKVKASEQGGNQSYADTVPDANAQPEVEAEAVTEVDGDESDDEPELAVDPTREVRVRNGVAKHIEEGVFGCPEDGCAVVICEACGFHVLVNDRMDAIYCSMHKRKGAIREELV